MTFAAAAALGKALVHAEVRRAELPLFQLPAAAPIPCECLMKECLRVGREPATRDGEWCHVRKPFGQVEHERLSREGKAQGNQRGSVSLQCRSVMHKS